MFGLQPISNYKRRFWQDPSLWSLAAVNIYFIYMAINMGISNQTMMWLYWCQSVLIGLFNVLRIITLGKFSTKDFKGMNGTIDLPATTGTKASTAFFFMVHYGIFHLVYYVFLSHFGPDTKNVDWEFVRSGAKIFLVNSCFTFIIQKSWDFTHVPKIGELMFLPYLRIIPLHLTIIFGAFFPGLSTAIFVTLKTIVDLAAQVIDTLLREKEYDDERKEMVSKWKKTA